MRASEGIGAGEGIPSLPLTPASLLVEAEGDTDFTVRIGRWWGNTGQVRQFAKDTQSETTGSRRGKAKQGKAREIGS